jgi:hypothetical protein
MDSTDAGDPPGDNLKPLWKIAAWAAAALVSAGLVAALTVRSGKRGSAVAAAPRVLPVGRMSVERAAHQATLLRDGRVLITGGCGGPGCDTIHASTELYDPASRSFRPAASMSTARASHAAVALPDGRILVAGGWTGSAATASAEIYDPAADRWTPAGRMTAARASLIAVPLRDGRVLIVGGGGGRLGDLASAEVFDSVASRFSAVGSMRTNHYLATALSDGRVLVTGGQDSEGKVLRTAELFDPATDEFTPTGSMAVPRVKHAAARLPDGRIMILGGSNGHSYRGRYRSTEIYDPRKGTFSPGPDLRWRRHKIRDAVAVLPSGAVLVAGGAVRPELFDPAGGAFVPAVGELSGPQMFATATLLPTGDVLVLGGYDERTRPSASAWLIRPGRVTLRSLP